MKLLIAGFKDEYNSAKILLDNVKKYLKDTLYLENDFYISVKQIEDKLLQNYDYVLIFGEKPETKNIYLEDNAKLDEIILTTDYDYINLKEKLENNKSTIDKLDNIEKLSNIIIEYIKEEMI